MTTATDHRTVSERYDTAAQSLDLSITADRGDADLLLAAGFASQADPRGAVALALMRRDMLRARMLAPECANWIVARVHRPTARQRLPRISRPDAIAVTLTVMAWFLNPACQACAGRGHPVMPNAARLDTSKDCGTCGGTGRHPVDKLLPHGQREHARWLADEFEALAGRIFGAMARRLAPSLDLDQP